MCVQELRENCEQLPNSYVSDKLLSHEDDSTTATLLDDREAVSSDGGAEALRIVRLAVPAVLTFLFSYLPTLFLVYAVGHLPDAQKDLAATALGRNFFSSSRAIVWGVTSALQTLAPQAEGAGRADLHALHCQRAALVVSTISIPLATIQFFSGDILKMLGEDATISDAAEPFAIRLIPRLYVEGYYSILLRIAQAMGFANGVAVLTSMGCLGAAVFLWLFIGVFGLGYLGAAWACVAWNVFNLATLVGFMFTRNDSCRKLLWPYSPWERVCHVAGLWEYITLAVPSMLQSCLEFWAVDLGVMLAAGRLPDPDLNLAANSIVASIFDLTRMVWIGIQSATSIEVGKYVGAGDSRGAQRSIRMACCVGLVSASVMSGILFFGRHSIAAAFSTSSALQDTVATTLIVLSFNAFADCLNCTLGGVLRGIGRQSKGVLFQVVGFYLVGFPLGALLVTKYGHRSFGLNCLWVAVACSALTSMVCSAVHIMRADWLAILEESRLRNESEC
eukprot:TRINITY_DN4225_c0_g2_i1.p1 TRINITY_DN4225_c0_g2~~TRINITY_DN4225_c0_g2_i1.p1  ORF type:complete len:504 (+),score=54.58 TRINITY_DN4225_c0_g2_i1:52-1563(+)